MKIESGKTYRGPEGAEWNITVILIDNGQAICLPNRPGKDRKILAEIKWMPGAENTIPAIDVNPCGSLRVPPDHAHFEAISSLVAPVGGLMPVPRRQGAFLPRKMRSIGRIPRIGDMPSAWV